MTEEELLELCREPQKRRIAHWTSEIYGFGAVLRKYGFFPSFLPLNIYFSHGITTHEVPAAHELKNKAPVMIYFSPRLVEAYRKMSAKKCYCVLSPNVFYRKRYKITQDSDAKGTLAFFSHTTPAIDNKMDVSLYISQLKALPEKYQPVSVCLHYHDVNKLFHREFMKEGIDVLTVGHQFQPDFIKRFYTIIRTFKFLTSNEIGSYTFYGPEAGIPFFLYGAGPEYYNNDDPNIEKGVYTSFRKTLQYQLVYEAFRDPTDIVTAKQTSIVENELGVYNSISRVHFGFILYLSFAKYVFVYLRRRFLKIFGL